MVKISCCRSDQVTDSHSMDPASLLQVLQRNSESPNSADEMVQGQTEEQSLNVVREMLNNLDETDTNATGVNDNNGSPDSTTKSDLIPFLEPSAIVAQKSKKNKSVNQPAVIKQTLREGKFLVPLPNARSRVWQYFGFIADANGQILNMKRVVCRLCFQELPYSGNTTNLSSHMGKYHPGIYQVEPKPVFSGPVTPLHSGATAESYAALPQSNSVDMSPTQTKQEPIATGENSTTSTIGNSSTSPTGNPTSPTAVSQATSLNNSPGSSRRSSSGTIVPTGVTTASVGTVIASSKKKASKRTAGGSIVGSSANSSTTSSSPVQNGHANKNGASTNTSQNRLVLLVTRELMPPELLESQTFSSAVYLDSVPAFNEQLWLLYQSQRALISDRLKQQQAPVSLTFETWTHATRKEYLEVRATWISETFERQEATLKNICLSENTDQTSTTSSGSGLAAALLQRVSDTLLSYELDDKWLVMVARSQPLFEQVAAALPQKQYASCLVFILQEAMNAVLRVPEVQRFMVPILLFSNASPLSRPLNNAQLFSKLQAFRDQSTCSDMLSPDDLNHIRDFLDIYEPMHKVVEILVERSWTPISLVQPVLNQLVKVYLAAKPDDSELLAVMKATVKAILLPYYDAAHDSDRDSAAHTRAHAKASFLDPRFKALNFLDVAERRDLYRAIEQEINAAGLAGQKNGSGPAGSSGKKTKQTGLATEFFVDSAVTNNGSNDDAPETAAQLEIDAYCLLKSLGPDADPLEWWAENHGRFPLLSSLARKYLSIPAASVPPSRAFSAIDTDSLTFIANSDKVGLRRPSLNCDILDYILFLHDKL